MKTVSLLSIVVIAATAGCSSGYKTESGKVYWCGWNEAEGKTKALVPGADASTFKVLRHGTYGKDSKRCYHETKPITNADPASFVPLTANYARDKRHAYYGPDLIPGSDAESFEIIDSKWSKDKNQCYVFALAVGIQVMTGADPKSFRVIGGYLNSWAADKHSYFYDYEKVPTRDPASFTILDGGFAKDEYDVFFQAGVVAGADSATFQMVHGTYIGRDFDSFYRLGQQFQPDSEWLRSKGLIKR